jgi:hypothetical protein
MQDENRRRSTRAAVPAGVTVLKKQLALRERLVAAGQIRDDHVFVHGSGELMRPDDLAVVQPVPITITEFSPLVTGGFGG